MGIIDCPRHGWNEIVATCSHAAGQIDSQRCGRLRYVGMILVCQDCFDAHGLSRFAHLEVDLMKLLTGEVSWHHYLLLDRDDEAYERFDEKFEEKTIRCTDCVKEAFVTQARREGKPDPCRVYENTLTSNHEDTIIELYNFLTDRFPFKPSRGGNHPLNKRNFTPRFSGSPSLYAGLAAATVVSAALLVIAAGAKNHWVFLGPALAIATGAGVRVFNDRRVIKHDWRVYFRKDAPKGVDTDLAVFFNPGSYSRPFTVMVYYVTARTEQDRVTAIVDEFFQGQERNQLKIQFFESERTNPSDVKLLEEIRRNC